LLALIDVPIDAATVQDAARHGSHRADIDYPAWGRDLETQIKLFYEIERRKQLDDGAVVEECCYAMERGPPQIREAATMRM